MVLLVASGEPGQHRDALWIKRGGVGRQIRILLQREVEPGEHVPALDQFFPDARRADPLQGQLVFPQPANHVKIQVGDHLLEVDGWLGGVAVGADQAQFLPGPKTEDYPTLKLLRMRLPPLGQLRRHLEQSRDAGGVVVGAVVDHAFLALDAEPAGLAPAKVIVVRP